MKDDKEKQQEPKQEVELEDLPVEESKQDNIKGGLMVLNASQLPRD